MCCVHLEWDVWSWGKGIYEISCFGWEVECSEGAKSVPTGLGRTGTMVGEDLHWREEFLEVSKLYSNKQQRSTGFLRNFDDHYEYHSHLSSLTLFAFLSFDSSRSFCNTV